MLDIEGLSRSFGGVRAVDGVSFRINAGELVGVIGPNGSGKSTLVNVITGFYAPSSGDIRLRGTSIAGRSPESIRGSGVVRTFQNLRLVKEMSVIENVLAGAYLDNVARGGLVLNSVRAIFGLPGFRASEAAVTEKANHAIELVGLQGKRDLKVGNLSYGDQKRLEIARALAIRPAVLILDEPTAGMAEDEAESLIGLAAELRSLAEHPMCVLLVEHRLELILQVSDRIIVLDSGRLVADGVPAEVGADPHVRRIYVGGE